MIKKHSTEHLNFLFLNFLSSEGHFGSAFVFAEVSGDMPSGEFVYILVQDKRNGQVVNVVDNRSSLLAKRMAGDNDAGRQALQNLLGGGSK